ncbi:hypothetical protein HanRHA438_Chr01g0035771 [Helianthus annuus]|nr:hypothetical protein HanRHA438_Chr01g0035771 [Helianthus annuus]
MSCGGGRRECCRLQRRWWWILLFFSFAQLVQRCGMCLARIRVMFGNRVSFRVSSKE